MEAEVGTGEDSGDDSMWDSDDIGGYDDECGEVEGGMAAKMWDEEEAMKGFEDTRSTLRLGIRSMYPRTTNQTKILANAKTSSTG